MTHDQEYLNLYFSKHWIPGNGRGITSPQEIARHVKDHEWLLDVGCGENPFKLLLSNVVGIDPAFDQADYKCTIEEFKSDRLFDVATCLGSINFGDMYVIERQIDKIVSLLKVQSRVYWRLNPGRTDHGNEYVDRVNFFPWTFDILHKFAVKYNYKQTVELIDEHPTKPRLYAEWHR